MDGAAASSSRTHVAADCRGPLPEPLRCNQRRPPPTHGLGLVGPGPRACTNRRSITERRSITSRDGVAHEAPLSKVWRDFRSARQRREPHASTRARLEVGAPVARQPTSPSAKKTLIRLCRRGRCEPSRPGIVRPARDGRLFLWAAVLSSSGMLARSSWWSLTPAEQGLLRASPLEAVFCPTPRLTRPRRCWGASPAGSAPPDAAPTAKTAVQPAVWDR